MYQYYFMTLCVRTLHPVSLWQVGSPSLHVPAAVQVLSFTPTRLYPVSQV